MNVSKKKISWLKKVVSINSISSSKQGMLKLAALTVIQDMRYFDLYLIQKLPAPN